MNKKLGFGVVTSTTAPLQKEAKYESTLVDEVLMGMVVEIIGEKENGYYYVETSYDYNGFLHKDDIVMTKEYPLKWKTEANNRLDVAYCDVLKEGKFQSYAISHITGGSTINCTGKNENQWVEIELPDGRLGWIREEFVSEKIDVQIRDVETLRDNIVQTAMKYLKTQYRWGGKSPLGIDCSGLCSMAYMLNGITIYRDAVFKEKDFEEIAFNEMKKGDLIFYKGHVAMYIGKGKIIHSTGSKAGVVIESLVEGDADYRAWLVDDIIAIGSHKSFKVNI